MFALAQISTTTSLLDYKGRLHYKDNQDGLHCPCYTGNTTALYSTINVTIFDYNYSSHNYNVVGLVSFVDIISCFNAFMLLLYCILD